MSESCCCVRGCPSRKGQGCCVVFYSLASRKPEVRMKRLEALAASGTDTSSLNDQSLICSKHFAGHVARSYDIPTIFPNSSKVVSSESSQVLEQLNVHFNKLVQKLEMHAKVCHTQTDPRAMRWDHEDEVKGLISRLRVQIQDLQHEKDRLLEQNCELSKRLLHASGGPKPDEADCQSRVGCEIKSVDPKQEKHTSDLDGPEDDQGMHIGGPQGDMPSDLDNVSAGEECQSQAEPASCPADVVPDRVTQRTVISQVATEAPGLGRGELAPTDPESDAVLTLARPEIPETGKVANSLGRETLEVLPDKAALGVSQSQTVPIKPKSTRPWPRGRRLKAKAMKTFVCADCGKVSPSANQLRRHALVHSGERKAKCPLCSQTFATKDGVTRHLETHGWEKPYKCSICNKSYTTLAYYKTHVKSQHPSADEVDKAFCAAQTDDEMNHDCETPGPVNKQESQDDKGTVVLGRAHRVTERAITDRMRGNKRDKPTEVKYGLRKRRKLDGVRCSVKEEPDTVLSPISRGKRASVTTSTDGSSGKLETDNGEKSGSVAGAEMSTPDESALSSRSLRASCKKTLASNKRKSLRGRKGGSPGHAKAKVKDDNQRGSIAGFEAYVCFVCGRGFSKMEALRAHASCHQEQVPCPVCGDHIHDPECRAAHLTQHTDALYQCKRCPKSMATFEALDAHVGEHKTGPFMYTCCSCEETFMLPSDFIRHISQQHYPESHPSHESENKQHSSEPHPSHESDTHGHTAGRKKRRVHLCKVCGHGFKSMQHRSHIRHELRCSVCGESFKTKVLLHAHKAQHPKLKILCDICGRDFKTQLGHRLHQLREHLRNDRTAFKCEVCDLHLSTKHQHAVHMTTHTGEKPHKCPICDKDFRLAGILSKHITTHAPNGRYQCSICGQFRRGSIAFREHMARHTGKWPLNCPHCNKGFLFKLKMQRHMDLCYVGKPLKCHLCDSTYTKKGIFMRHLAEAHSCLAVDDNRTSLQVLTKNDGSTSFSVVDQKKRHMCDVCGKSFMRPCLLKQHMRAHTEDDLPNYDCSLCGKHFVHKHGLDRHLAAHKKGQPHKCVHCNRAYSKRKHLNKHMRLLHAEKTGDDKQNVARYSPTSMRLIENITVQNIDGENEKTVDDAPSSNPVTKEEGQVQPDSKDAIYIQTIDTGTLVEAEVCGEGKVVESYVLAELKHQGMEVTRGDANPEVVQHETPIEEVEVQVDVDGDHMLTGHVIESIRDLDSGVMFVKLEDGVMKIISYEEAQDTWNTNPELTVQDQTE